METRSNHVLVGTVTLALIAGLLIFIVWLAGLSNKATSCFDIYFSQGVGGLNKGSSVNYQGVPVGQIEKISLMPDRPEFVWVRISVKPTPLICAVVPWKIGVSASTEIRTHTNSGRSGIRLIFSI